MISHVFVGIRDFDRAYGFYAGLLAALGHVEKFCERGGAQSWAGWHEPGRPRPLFIIGTPVDGGAASPGKGQMVALLAPSRAAVDRGYALALAQGAADAGAPGLRPQYHADYYGAYFRDLDGNKIALCCHEAED